MDLLLRPRGQGCLRAELQHVRAEGCRPCVATYSAIRRSFSASMCRDRVENSPISSSGTPTSSHAGLRSRPRSRATPTRSEGAGEPVGQGRVVELGDGDDRRVHRPSGQGAPFAVLGGLAPCC
jgi:hypothetical protein